MRGSLSRVEEAVRRFENVRRKHTTKEQRRKVIEARNIALADQLAAFGAPLPPKYRNNPRRRRSPVMKRLIIVS